MRGPITVIGARTYGALLEAHCLEGPCEIVIVDRTTIVVKLVLQAKESNTAYHKVFGDELKVTQGLARLVWCELDIPLPSPH